MRKGWVVLTEGQGQKGNVPFLASVQRTIPRAAPRSVRLFLGLYPARRPMGAQKMDRSGGTRAEPAEGIAQPSKLRAGKRSLHPD